MTSPFVAYSFRFANFPATAIPLPPARKRAARSNIASRGPHGLRRTSATHAPYPIVSGVCHRSELVKAATASAIPSNSRIKPTFNRPRRRLNAITNPAMGTEIPRTGDAITIIARTGTANKTSIETNIQSANVIFFFISQ